MNCAFHIVVVLAVALHALCGCCVHHAHARGGPSDTKALTVKASCKCHHGCVGPDQSCDHTLQQQQCDEVRCVFTRPDSNNAPDLSIGHGCVNPVCVLPGISTLSGIDEVDSSPENPGEPIPLHLLNQAILL